MDIKSKSEDIVFSVIRHLPIVPSFLMNWANDYLSRRIAELEHETIRQQWDKASLEKTLSKIHDRQQDKEKH
jgi:cell division protein FtsB